MDIKIRNNQVGSCGDKTGTSVTFMPSNEIFSNIHFVYETLEARMRQIAFLNSKIAINLEDERGKRKKSQNFILKVDWYHLLNIWIETRMH